jgi:hypothetical protein
MRSAGALLIFLVAACASEPTPAGRPARATPPTAPAAPASDDGAIRIKGTTRAETARVTSRTPAEQARIDQLEQLAAATQGRGVAPPHWTEYSSASGHFVAAYPAAPSERDSLDMNVLVLELPESHRVYEAGYRDLDPSEPQDDTTALLDDRLQEFIRRHSDARLVSRRSVATIGRPGLEARIETPIALIALRLYVGDGRLYQVVMKAPPDEPAPDEARHFLESFRVAGG